MPDLGIGSLLTLLAGIVSLIFWFVKKSGDKKKLQKKVSSEDKEKSKEQGKKATEASKKVNRSIGKQQDAFLEWEKKWRNR